MTEKTSLIPRIIGAALAALLLIGILVFVLPSLSQLLLNTTVTNQIASNGTLTPVGTGTVPTGGTTPIGIAVTGTLQ